MQNIETHIKTSIDFFIEFGEKELNISFAKEDDDIFDFKLNEEIATDLEEKLRELDRTSFEKVMLKNKDRVKFIYSKLGDTYLFKQPMSLFLIYRALMRDCHLIQEKWNYGSFELFEFICTALGLGDYYL